MTLNSYLSIVTLNVNGLSDPSKGAGFQTGKKSKTHLFSVYKTLIVDIKTPAA